MSRDRDGKPRVFIDSRVALIKGDPAFFIGVCHDFVFLLKSDHKTERRGKMVKHVQGILILVVCVSFAGVAFAKKPVGESPLVVLGKIVYEDPGFSAEGNQSCQTCHDIKARFSDPVGRISPMYRPVSEGSIQGRFGGRNAPPAAYAAYSPAFNYDPIEGLFVGGLFWDGRATGISVTDTGLIGDGGPTYDPLADQAKGPFGNPVEMALEDPAEEVVARVKGMYSKEYYMAFPTPHDGLEDTGVAYNNIALAISAYEKSDELNQFESKFDRFHKEQEGNVEFTELPESFVSEVYTLEEAEGLALFNGKGQCALCHPTADFDTKTASVFTDFSFDNLGIPVNEVIAGLAGAQSTDYGLGARKAEMEAAYFNAMGENMPADMVALQNGKFKVSSLRNIAKTAPYGHNGFFPTLYDIVHFYNTRDILSWPKPEIQETVNQDELGDLGLTFEEEQKLVVFLETLTDEERM